MAILYNNKKHGVIRLGTKMGTKIQQKHDLWQNSACAYTDVILASTTNSVSAHSHPIVCKYLDYSTTLADLGK